MDVPNQTVLARTQRLFTLSRLARAGCLVVLCSFYAACSSIVPRDATAERTAARSTRETTAPREVPSRPGLSDNKQFASPDIGEPQATPPPENYLSPPRVTGLSPEQAAPPAKRRFTTTTVSPPSQRELGVVKLYFATDRQWTGETEPPKWFGSEWNNTTPDPLTYGTCEVSIPVSHHEIGEIEKRSLFRILIRDPEDPKRDVIVRQPQRFEKDEFFGALAGEVAMRAEKEVIVFIHGFNNTFDDAASRLGVLAYDLKFEGVPVLYSWSSTGGLLGFTLGSYRHDEQVVTKTESALTEFLASVTQTARAAGAQRVNVVAHSMGNRPLVAALRSLAEREGNKITIDEVVMAAPDVQQEGFADTYGRKLQCPGGIAERVTLYASSKDQALIVSRKLHGGFRRIGEGGDMLLCLPGLDTVDASGCDFHRFGLNHTYFGGPKIIADLAKILNPGWTPLQRQLREMKQRKFGYWMLPELGR